MTTYIVNHNTHNNYLCNCANVGLNYLFLSVIIKSILSNKPQLWKHVNAADYRRCDLAHTNHQHQWVLCYLAFSHTIVRPFKCGVGYLQSVEFISISRSILKN